MDNADTTYTTFPFRSFLTSRSLSDGHMRVRFSATNYINHQPKRVEGMLTTRRELYDDMYPGLKGQFEMILQRLIIVQYSPSAFISWMTWSSTTETVWGGFEAYQIPSDYIRIDNYNSPLKVQNCRSPAWPCQLSHCASPPHSLVLVNHYRKRVIGVKKDKKEDSDLVI